MDEFELCRGEGGRFLFYSHDGVGLGHARRNLAIAGAVADLSPGASVLVATSAERAESLGVPPNVDILKLPGLRKLGNGRYAARRLRISRRDVSDVRAALLAAAVESFRPDVVLADKHPLGADGELRPALEIARDQGARLVLGLRDILDDAVEVAREWAAADLFGWIEELYDRVLVYGQADIVDPVGEYGFPSAAASMTHFCGYVVRPPPFAAPAAPDRSRASRPRVLATAGGGEDGSDLLAMFIEAAAGRPWDAQVVTGPHCAAGPARRLLRLGAEAGVGCRRFAPELGAQFGSFDALVCMGGYNTLTEAVASGVPTVCVPRVRPRREQLLRARAFARLGLLSVVEPGGLSAGRLREAIESAMCPPLGGARGSLDLGGAGRAASHLVELATGRGIAVEAALA